MTREKFINMANKILIDIDENVLLSLENEFNFIDNNMNNIKNINIDGVEPMSRISPPITFLREDIEYPALEKEKLLSNAFNSNEDYVVIKRILK
ncbi:MAG: aspartyl/glutamyl-tRNA amidotransferase subunit C [Mycoplasmataceae bacterium]|nr:aspartyl/glutamyl-tRNA amidotransferase subunit C [Mycoplasmataceae bacterium]